MMRSWLSVTACLGLVACAPDLRRDYCFDGLCGDGETGPKVTIEATGDAGIRRALVDATDKTAGARTFVDLDADAEVSAPNVLGGDSSWDLAFQRDKVSTNGGIASGGHGTVQVAVLKGVDFEGLTQAPAGGYLQDTEKLVFNDVEGGWYNYDLGVHRLITRGELLYVVRSSDDRYFKLRMLNYYDESGSPARVSFEYQVISNP